ncbi:MAG TPA: NfeD family protein [Blastocatellia bacterium]|nr:NfeD family protein [Blastocatellia bacterium]
MWIIWLVIAALLIAGEVATTGFFLLWFGIGAAVAALAALLGVSSLPLQIIIFLVVSILLVVASRTIFEKYLMRRNSLRTGVDSMIGEIVSVVEASRGARNEAAVKAFGSVWTAIPLADEEPLQIGESVKIDRVDGNTVYVYRPSHHSLLKK